MIDHPGTIWEEARLRGEVEQLANQLCLAVDGRLDFTVGADSNDPTVQKLQMLINFVLDAARRAVAQVEERNVQLEEHSRLRSEFLANMSHEIRTPMNGVLGMAGLLLDTELTREQREFAQTIYDSGDGLLVIINDILDFSKIEAGELVIEPQPMDLFDAVEDIGELLAVRAAEKNLEFIIDYAPGTPRRVTGDSGRIRQILTNLVGNAIKFTAAGHILVHVECLQDQSGEGLFKITVADTGIGIPPDKTAYIFEQFTQADASTTRKFGGTGLGLAISRSLVQKMGGQIGVDSEPGRGSTFWFTLRLPLGPETHPSKRTLERLREVSVLVIDDHPVNRRVLSEQLKRAGMRPVYVSSGEEGLAAQREAVRQGRPFPLIVTDHQMPEMDGERLGQAILSDPELSRQSRLIMLSSVAMAGDALRLRKMGFFDYLTKPARPSELLDCLDRALETLADAAEPDSVKALDSTLTLRKSAPGESATARILLVEDNPINQKVALRFLEKMGCRVDVAAHGKEAVHLFGLLPYDAVLMDCQMPVMDGFEATQEIRRRYPDRPVPILAMTAHAMQGDRERCLQAGMDDYLSKPFKHQDLHYLLHKWVVAKRASPSAPGAPEAPLEKATAESDYRG